MQFLTPRECEQWLIDRSRSRPDIAELHDRLRLSFPSSPYRFFYWSNCIATSIANHQPCLLWITESGIWPSSQNLHLYYRLRQGYQDLRLLEEAPGHLFLKHETNDLASFLQLAMLFGWGGYLLSEANYVNAYFSHDEFIDFYSHDKALIDELRNGLESSVAAVVKNSC
jgi:hypothetical protein